MFEQVHDLTLKAKLSHTWRYTFQCLRPTPFYLQVSMNATTNYEMRERKGRREDEELRYLAKTKTVVCTREMKSGPTTRRRMNIEEKTSTGSATGSRKSISLKSHGLIFNFLFSTGPYDYLPGPCSSILQSFSSTTNKALHIFSIHPQAHMLLTPPGLSTCSSIIQAFSTYSSLILLITLFSCVKNAHVLL